MLSSHHSQLLSTKNDIPRFKERLVARSHLWSKLNQGLNRKLTVLCGPAGSGKTTLLVQWLNDRQHPLIWVSLDQGDNDPLRFLEYLTNGIERHFPTIAQAIRTLFQSPQPPTARAVSTTLINQLSALPQLVVIALDDYHLIRSKALHDSLGFILEHLPTNVHLYITSRKELDLPLTRLRVDDELIEIRTDELTFNAQEVDAYINRIMGLSLNREQLEILTRRSEGWIVGLKMAALSLQRVKDANEYIEHFAGTDRYILDYMLDQVLDQQPPDVREFLLKTSILGRLHQELCDSLLDNQHSSLILKQIEEANLFIIPLDHYRGWYRYHHLFGELLRHYLQREHRSTDIEQLHRRACQWFLQHGHIEEAIHHALATHDYDLASSLIQRHQQTFSRRGQMATLREWYHSIPPDYWSQKPYLSLSYAWALIESDLHFEVEQILAAAETNIDQYFQDPTQRPQFEAQVAILRSSVNLEYEVLNETLRYSQLALDKLSEPDHTNACVAHGNMGIVHEYQANPVDAIARMETALRHTQRYGLPLNSLWLLSHLAKIQFRQGQFLLASQILQQANSIATVNRIGHIPANELCHLVQGWLALELGNPEQALTELNLAIEAGQLGRNYWLIPALATKADLYRIQHELPKAIELMTEAEQLARNRVFSHRWSDHLCSLMALLFIDTNQIHKARQFLSDFGLPSTNTHMLKRPLLLLSMIQLYLWLNDLQLARQLLQQYLAQPGTSAWLSVQLIERLLQAELACQEGDTLQARQLLQAALVLAPQYQQSYLNYCRHSLPLLKQCLLEQQQKGLYFNEVLLQRLEQRLQPTSAPERSSLLSDREIDVLLLIRGGAKNIEIAEQLHIAVSTVKTHINNIYTKLEVRNRIEALRKAEEQGLL